MVKDRKMVLKPLSVVMLSDGVLDVPGKNGRHDYRGIDLSAMEKLSRNVTLRLLYTDPTVGKKWESQVPRRRVKVWTQEAPVMETWKDPKIFTPNGPMEKQVLFRRRSVRKRGFRGSDEASRLSGEQPPWALWV